MYYGFDSFEDFSEPFEKDEATPITGEGFWANPPATVLKVRRDGRIPEETIRDRIRLVKGRFDKTLLSATSRYRRWPIRDRRHATPNLTATVLPSCR